MILSPEKLRKNFEEQLQFIFQWIQCPQNDTKKFVYQIVQLAIKKANALDFTDCDNIYLNGLKEKNYDVSDVESIVAALIDAYALLTTYGLSEKEYIQWVDRQKTNITLFFYGLVGADTMDSEKKYVRNEIIKNSLKIFNPYKSIVVSKQEQFGKHSFKLYDRYIIFDEEFDKQIQLKKQFPILRIEIKNDWKMIFEEEIDSLDKALEKFPELAINFIKKEGAKCFRCFRDKNVLSAEDWQEFQDLSLSDKIIEKYCEKLVEKYIGTIGKIDKGIMHAIMDTAFPIPEDYGVWAHNFSGVIKGTIKANIVGKAAGVVNEVADFVETGRRQGRWASEKKSCFRSEEFKTLFLNLFPIEVAQNYYIAILDILGTKDVVLSNRQVEENYKKIISNEIKVSEQDLTDFLFSYIRSKPFDEKIYTLLYCKYGKQVKEDINAIVNYLDISTQYDKKLEEDLDGILQGYEKEYDRFFLDSWIALSNRIKEFSEFYDIDMESQLLSAKENQEKIARIKASKPYIDEKAELGDYAAIFEEALGEEGNGYAEFKLMNTRADWSEDKFQLKQFEKTSLYYYIWRYSVAKMSDIEKWAEDGVISANINIAIEKLDTWYEDKGKAIGILKEVALYQQPEAAYFLGKSYYYGTRALKKNYDLSRKYLLQATSLGHRAAFKFLSEKFNDTEDKEVQMVLKAAQEEEERRKNALLNKRKIQMSAEKSPESINSAEINSSLDSNEEHKYCIYCGKKILRSSKFCNYCGKKQ